MRVDIKSHTQEREKENESVNPHPREGREREFVESKKQQAEREWTRIVDGEPRSQVNLTVV